MFLFPKLRNLNTRFASTPKKDLKEPTESELDPARNDSLIESSEPNGEKQDVKVPLEQKDTISLEADNSSKTKKRRISSELRLLTRDDYRLSKKVDENNPSTVQLYAADFANVEAPLDGPRPKRRLKAVSRYEDTRRSYNEEKELQELQGRIGSGFLCPACHAHLGYDLKMCWNCGLECYYSAGIGVVVCKDRSNVSKVDVPVPNKISKKTDVSANYNTRTRHTQKVRHLETTQNDSKIDSKNTSKTDIAEMIQNADTRECEACLQLFLPAYLQRHRRRCHQLSTEEFGCPHCTTHTFQSMHDRAKHIQKLHRGLPVELTAKEKAQTKLYLYDCPKCSCSMTYGDLRDHMQSEHDLDMNDFISSLTCTCPFCLLYSKPVRRKFQTIEGFLSHVKSDHKGCTVIGMRLKIGEKNTQMPWKASSSIQMKKLKKEEEPSTKNDHDLNVEREENAVPQDAYWEDFTVDQLDLGEIDAISQGRNKTIESLLRDINDKIKRFEKRVKGGPDDDDDFNAEQKMYIRGIRERTNKAESEALEKAMFKDKCEEMQRVLDYQNRGKKKSLAEIEYEELLRRPIQFVSTKTGHKSEPCFIGETCDLCGTDHACHLVTASEISCANGNVKDAIDKAILGHNVLFIPSLKFRKIDDSDLPNDRDEASTEKVDFDEKVTTRRGSGSDKMQLWKLYELKHTLEFMMKFNTGFLTSK